MDRRESFLLRRCQGPCAVGPACNNVSVTSLLLDQQARTMVPAFSQFLNSENDTTDQIRAITAAVSITAPLFLLVIAFQRQIVSGLTTDAVKE